MWDQEESDHRDGQREGRSMCNGTEFRSEEGGSGRRMEGMVAQSASVLDVPDGAPRKTTGEPRLYAPAQRNDSLGREERHL